jgi:hypothetical protein
LEPLRRRSGEADFERAVAERHVSGRGSCDGGLGCELSEGSCVDHGGEADSALLQARRHRRERLLHGRLLRAWRKGKANRDNDFTNAPYNETK